MSSILLFAASLSLLMMIVELLARRDAASGGAMPLTTVLTSIAANDSTRAGRRTGGDKRIARNARVGRSSSN